MMKAFKTDVPAAGLVSPVPALRSRLECLERREKLAKEELDDATRVNDTGAAAEAWQRLKDIRAQMHVEMALLEPPYPHLTVHGAPGDVGGEGAYQG
jgi:hypothetical protein